MWRSSPTTSIRAPRARRPAGDPGEPVGFLVAQLAGAADRRARHGPSRRPGRGPGSRRWPRPRRPDRGRCHAAPPSARPGRRAARRRRESEPRPAPASARTTRCGRSSMSAPIRREQVDDRAPRRVDADVAQGQLGVGMDRAGDQPEGGRGHVARDSLIDRLQRHPSLDRPGHRPSGPLPRSTGTPRARSIRSVWSRVAIDSRTVVRPSARRPASRTADFTCALGTGGGVVDGRQWGTTGHGQGREGIVLPGTEQRPHRAQRFDDTSHRTAAQQIVAVQGGGDGQAGEDPARQPQARAGVAAVERGRRLSEPIGARRDHAVVDGPAVLADAFHRRAEGPHDPGRGADIGAVAGGRDPALALGHGGQQQRAMADRLVAGQAQLAAQAPGRCGRARRSDPAPETVEALNAWPARRCRGPPTAAPAPGFAPRGARGRAHGPGRWRPSGRGSPGCRAAARRRRAPRPGSDGPRP